jgi:hypothetical protein
VNVAAASKSTNSKWLAAFALAVLWLVVWFLVSLGILLMVTERTADQLLPVVFAGDAVIIGLIAGCIHRSFKVSLLILFLIVGLVLAWMIAGELIVVE